MINSNGKPNIEVKIIGKKLKEALDVTMNNSPIVNTRTKDEEDEEENTKIHS